MLEIVKVDGKTVYLPTSRIVYIAANHGDFDVCHRAENDEIKWLKAKTFTVLRDGQRVG